MKGFGLGLKDLKKALAVGVASVSLLALSSAPTASAAGFQEYEIGDEQEVASEHFKVALVYFQPIEMVPEGMMLSPDKADIHIETDIHATEGNDTGFGVGEWIPYLKVNYVFTKRDTGEKLEGAFMPMSADDGPHYGANVKLMGAGMYDCDFYISSPADSGYGLHVDEETGVPGRFWEEPIHLHWDFQWVPRKW